MASFEETLHVGGAPAEHWPAVAATLGELCDASVEGPQGWSAGPVRRLLRAPAAAQLEWSAPSRVHIVVNGIALRVELDAESAATRVRVRGEWADHAREGFAATTRLALAVRRALGVAAATSSRLRLAGGDVETAAIDRR